MTKNKRLIISLVIAFIFDFPMKWIQYKGGEMVSIVQIFEFGINNLFFDLTLLMINTFIVYLTLTLIFKFNEFAKS